MIEEILKYLSPVAGLGLLWGIIQFYQKRRHTKLDIQRQEKQAAYKEIDSVLKEIKNEYWILFAVTSQVAISLKKKIDQYKNAKSTIEKDLEDSKIDRIVSEEINAGYEILEEVEKEGYDEKKHKALLLEQLNLANNRKMKIESAEEKLDQLLHNLNKDEKKISAIGEEENQKLSDKTTETRKSLQQLILKLNKISLIGIDDNGTLKILIFNLKKAIQEQVNQLEAEEYIDSSNITDLLKMEDLKDTMMIIDALEEHIHRI